MWPFDEQLPKYDRGDWPHWTDEDRNGEDTRQEILERDSLLDVERGTNGLIAKGLWVCPYTGRALTNTKRVHIDHVIALKEAHLMGGHAWDREKRKQFANDFDNLLASYSSANIAKGFLSSYKGMPPNIHIWNRFLIVREQIVAKYDLTQSDDELKAVKFYRSKYKTHKNWIKMTRVRMFLSRWMPGMF